MLVTFMLLALGSAGAIGGQQSAESLVASFRVVDEAGIPLNGAPLAVVNDKTARDALDLRRRDLIRSRTDASGRPRNALPNVAQTTLVIDDPRYAPRFVSLPLDTDRVTVSRGAQLRVQVPLENAKRYAGVRLDHLSALELQRGVCGRWSEELSPAGKKLEFRRCAGWSGLIESATGTSLQARLGGLPAGEVKIEIFLEGHLIERFHQKTAAKQIRRELPTGTVVRCEVLDTEGLAIAGAVALSNSGSFGIANERGLLDIAVEALPSNVTFAALGFAREQVLLTSTDLERGCRVSLKAAQGVTFDFDTSQMELSDLAFEVYLGTETAAGTDWRPARRIVRRHELSATVELAQPGLYRFVLKAPEVVGKAYPPVWVPPGEFVHLGLVEMDQGTVVLGRVVDASSGEPIAGARVGLMVDGLSLFESMERSATAHTTGTDEFGSFQITGLTAGDYSLVIEDSDRGKLSRTLHLADNERYDLGTFDFGPGTLVRFVVERRDHRPVRGARVALFPEGPESIRELDSSLTDEDGLAVLPAIQNGNYRVLVETTRVLLEQGVRIEDSEEAEFELVVPSVSIEGLVRLDGISAAGGSLSIIDDSDPGRVNVKQMVAADPAEGVPTFWAGLSRSLVKTQVDNEGRFHLEDVEPGSSLASYTSLDGVTYETDFTVVAEGISDVVLDFQSNVFRGRVLATDSGEGIPASLVVYDRAGGVGWFGNARATGEFEIHSLMSRSHLTLVIKMEDYRQREIYHESWRDLPQPFVIELGPGEETELSIVLTRHNGSPMVRSRVALLGPQGEVFMALMTDQNGRRSFGTRPLGTYYVVWTDAVAGTGAAEVTWGSGASERRLGVSEGVPVEVRCAEAWCASQALDHLRLRARAAGDVDIAPFLPGSFLGRMFSADAAIYLGKVAPGQYQLELIVGGEVVRQSIAIGSGAERVTVWF